MGGLTALLDTAIGLTLIFLGSALFVTVANEAIAGIIKKRSTVLTENLQTLFDGTGLSQLVAGNPAFQPLLDVTKKVRSYADPKVLAQVLVGTLASQFRPLPAQPAVAGGAPLAPGQAPPPATGTDSLLQAIDALPTSQVKNVLWTIAQSAGKDIDKLTQAVSEWIDRSLIVLGEGYKRWAQLLSFGLGLLLAIGFNIDTLGVGRRLYADKELRDSMTATAEDYVKKASPELVATCPKLDAEERKTKAECAPIQALADAIAKRNDTFGKLPIGWESFEQFRKLALPGRHGLAAWFPRLIGWLLTALAISLGAPFWFDLLNRFVNVRTTIRRPEADGKS
jgi:hypothetical protein